MGEDKAADEIEVEETKELTQIILCIAAQRTSDVTPYDEN